MFVQVKAVSSPAAVITPLTVKALLHRPEEPEELDEHEALDEFETLEELDELSSAPPFFAKAGVATAKLPTNKMANSLCFVVFIVFTLENGKLSYLKKNFHPSTS